jgi:hypothetical protein
MKITKPRTGFNANWSSDRGTSTSGLQRKSSTAVVAVPSDNELPDLCSVLAFHSEEIYTTYDILSVTGYQVPLHLANVMSPLVF